MQQSCPSVIHILILGGDLTVEEADEIKFLGEEEMMDAVQLIQILTDFTPTILEVEWMD